MKSQQEWILESLEKHVDKNGKLLFENFIHLPSKENKEYYKMITNPVSFTTIKDKLGPMQNKPVDLKKELATIVENASNFNSRRSAVFKEAQLILGVYEEYLEKYKQMKEIYQQIDNFMNKCDSYEILDDLPEDKVETPISLSMIREKHGNQEYTTLAEFEQDIQLLISNTCEIYGSDTENHKAAKELQTMLQEINDEVVLDQGDDLEEITIGKTSYKIGDFVYIKNPEDDSQPTIGQVFSCWQEKDEKSEKQGLNVCWFLRPNQIVAKQNTKFMLQEVFKTNHLERYEDSEILGKCIVLFYRDYVKGTVKGFDKKDVYVCESRYNENAKTVSKIKNWVQCLPEKVKNVELDLELYPTPIVPTRAALGQEHVQPEPKRRRDEDNAPKFTRDQLQKLQNQRPQYHVPIKGPMEGKWYPTPPVNVVKRNATRHSLEYLLHMAKKKKTVVAKVVPKVIVPEVQMKESIPREEQLDALENVLAGFGDALFKDAVKLKQAIHK
ncbi:hypothetical protein HK103_007180 [Boothiomyces macroporosus]|uniref:Uncharacterized protein n=1 Tax=Boothiomyces macroporosus TaxID=261099 RepID=A0AAD5Y1J9_9FUNG|nr:hypothetical protein HK103_007180 [Boothiomyces macroporosus]